MVLRIHDRLRSRPPWDGRRCRGVLRPAAEALDPFEAARVAEWAALCGEASDVLNASLERIDDSGYLNVSLRARLVVRGFEKLGLLPDAAACARRATGRRLRRLLPAARVAAVCLVVCAIAAHVAVTVT